MAALAVLLVLLHAASAAAQGKGPTVVMTGGTLYHSVDVAPNSISTFTVTCPPGYVAMSSTASIPDGATQLRSVPAGARSWTFSFGLPATATRSSHVTVLVVCSKPRPFLPGIGGTVKIKIKVKKVKSGSIVVPPGDTESKRLKCPAGEAPTGSGTSVTPGESTPKGLPARAAAVPSNGDVLRETEDMPVRGGFHFTVHNRSAEPQRVRFAGRCLRRRASYRRRGHRRRHRCRTKVLRELVMDMATPGSNLFMRSPRRRHFPVGAGYRYASDADLIVFGHAISRSGEIETPAINGETMSLPFRSAYLELPGELMALR